MGFSISGSTVVIFIGLLVSAATLYPALDSAQEARVDAIDDKSERMLVTTNTAVTITDTDDANGLTVTARNTGATALDVGTVDLLVDGTYRVPDTTAVAGDTETSTWQPGETLELTVSGVSTPDRVKIVTGPGVAATTEVT